MKTYSKVSLGFVLLLMFGVVVSFALLRTPAKSVSATDSEEGVMVHNISLLSDRAVPEELVIVLGEYIQFNTKDDKIHNIAQGQGSEEVHSSTSRTVTSHDHDEAFVDSGPFGKGEAYKVRINKTGAYFFHDHLNPSIYITVLVYEPKK